MIETIETVWIPMPTGQTAARLWLPKMRARNPSRHSGIHSHRRRDKTRIGMNQHPVLAEAGYAAIRADMRGNGDSDGVMLDEYTDLETQDGVDVIASIATGLVRW